MTDDLQRYRRIAADIRGLLNIEGSIQQIVLLLHEFGQVPKAERQLIVGETLVLVRTGLQMSVQQEGLDFSESEIRDIAGAAVTAALDMLGQMPLDAGRA